MQWMCAHSIVQVLRGSDTVNHDECRTIATLVRSLLSMRDNGPLPAAETWHVTFARIDLDAPTPRLLEIPVHSDNRNLARGQHGATLRGLPGPCGGVCAVISDGAHHEPVWWDGNMGCVPLPGSGLPDEVTIFSDLDDATLPP